MKPIEGLTRREERELKRKLAAPLGLSVDDVSTVAISGDYNDLANLPTLGTAAAQNSTAFAAASHTHAQSDITNLVSDLAGKASSSHTHTASNITDFSEAVDDRVAALVVAGANVTATYDDVANTLTIAASGGGGGSYSSPLNGWLA